jgi:undecaprenyl-diphosphatase
MNGVDLFLLKILNGFAHLSSAFDATVGFVADQPFLKGALLTSMLWFAWFRPDPEQKRHRELVISTLAATIASLAIAKLVRSLLPFRLRPIHDAASGITLPYHVSTETLWNWSSFPSDTAAMAFALAGGLLMICARWGWPAILYSLAIICIPRIFLGYHYPSDVLAGTLIGLLTSYIMSRDEIRTSLSRRVLAWSENYTGAFYCASFLFTCEVAGVFEDLRRVISTVWKLSRNSL